MPDHHPAPDADTDAETGSNPVRPRDERIIIGGFQFIEHGLLILVVVMTLIATGMEILTVIEARTVGLGDILLMFLYTEVIAMVAVFYTGRGVPFVYPIFIAITALSRLIVLQGKEMDPQNILVEAAAILLLAIAAVVVLKLGKPG